MKNYKEAFNKFCEIIDDEIRGLEYSEKNDKYNHRDGRVDIEMTEEEKQKSKYYLEAFKYMKDKWKSL